VKTQHGTLTKKSGSWLGHYSRWLINPDTGGKTRQQKSYVIGRVDSITKAAARRALRVRIEQELGLRADSRVTLTYFLEHRWQPLREGTWRDSTRATNLWILSHIKERFGAVPLEDADSVALQTWVNHLAKTHSGSLVKHVRIFLRSIFDEATEQDYIGKSPARLLRIPVLKPVEKPYLTQPQMHKLLKAAKGMDRLLLRVALVTALRPSELFALRWAAFDADKKLLRITESIYRGKVRQFTKTTDTDSRKELQVVFLPDILVTELEDWRKETVYEEDHYPIFPNSYGAAWWKENYQRRRLNPLAKQAGVKVNFQVLRRTVSTHSQSMGSAKDTAAVLRHSRPDTAAIHYTQQQDASVRGTVDKLAALLNE
jgi:integrase